MARTWTPRQGHDYAATPVAARSIHKSFRRDTGEIVKALDGVSFEARQGTLTALVGPDGAGKTTLLRLIAGLMVADSGELSVLDVDVAAEPQIIQNRIGYMPQKFGLYEDLSVQQNLDLYADLHGISRDQRKEIYPRLMEMTDLGRFTQRLAGKLSGGMKQKLGLACTLVRAPELLLLDEPTVGVDPLSRRELWDIVTKLVHEDQLTVVVSTSYLDEAELCDHAVVMHLGKVLAQGKPDEITAKAKDSVFHRDARQRNECPFAAGAAVPAGGRCRCRAGSGKSARREAARLCGRDPHRWRTCQSGAECRRDSKTVSWCCSAQWRRKSHSSDVALDRPKSAGGDEISVEVHDLVRTFGDFTAVNHVSFEVEARRDLRAARSERRRQEHDLPYAVRVDAGDATARCALRVRTCAPRARKRGRSSAMSRRNSRSMVSCRVDENLDFFASAYGLRGRRKRERIAWSKEQFELGDLATLPSGQLPGGFKQRLAMAAALLHEPDILFLDEATSGADPLARREFWGRITALSEQGVTVIVTTHFMEEAEYCDRIIILDAGRNLAEGTPAEIRAHAKPRKGEEPNDGGCLHRHRRVIA